MEPLILLHGALGSSVQLQPLADALSITYDVHLLDFSGHGGKPVAAEAFSMEMFANDVISYMMLKGLDKVSVFGYSMGGYVGMYLARHYPARVKKVVTLATKYHWDEATAAREVQMLNPEKIEQKLPAFAATLIARHAPTDWTTILGKTAELMTGLGAANPLLANDYTAITTPSLLLLGDRDKMVSLDETVAVYKSLPAAQLGILPGTSHPIEQVDVDMLAMMIYRFVSAK
ncbi:MAG: alpha/beta fold hydrolase [Taibaiella sp.]|nr:alpha/beta fold hydrolase [Taibaiella sp.]